MSLPLLFTSVATISAASIGLYWYNTDSKLSGDKNNYNALIVSLVSGILMFLFAAFGLYLAHK